MAFADFLFHEADAIIRNRQNRYSGALGEDDADGPRSVRERMQIGIGCRLGHDNAKRCHQIEFERQRFRFADQRDFKRAFFLKSARLAQSD